MFKFDIGNEVCYASDQLIHRGTVIGRRLVEAPRYHKLMHEFHDRAKTFSEPGNRLGMSGIRYEIEWFDDKYKGKTSVIEEDKLFASPWDVSEHFTRLAEKIEEGENDE